MTRFDANIELMNQLHSYLSENKDVRFGQALRNVGIVVDKWNVDKQENEWINLFYEEPQFTLNRVRQRKEGPSDGR